jgi:hypothetical protein
VQRVGVVLGALLDPLDRLGESFECLGTLGLGGFEHQSLIDDQREIDSRRMETLFQQGLGHVESAHAVGVLKPGRT